ncbi:zinc finger CCCH domain-containing protein 53-like protein [Tanacetum coccineum]
MKDYIATTKANGYQSIHTTVILFLYGSTFRLEVKIKTEEMNLIASRGIVAHYSCVFSISLMYGPVQYVWIPYQQKQMFGFVTFVYTETVKLILAKGNPHFVCDARVLVKPYKEKGKANGAWMLYNNQDLLWRKKLEEQADLQHAVELQNRRLMDLQLLDVKRNHPDSGNYNFITVAKNIALDDTGIFMC